MAVILLVWRRDRGWRSDGDAGIVVNPTADAVADAAAVEDDIESGGECGLTDAALAGND